MAHPHPALGGTMLNKVVFHTARVLNHDLDYASLRFNFRGVGRSEGDYDHARGEIADLESAWEEAGRRAPGLPLIAGGFSFGAAMSLLAAAGMTSARRPEAMALVGVPMRLFSFPDPFPLPIPIAAVHGEHDEFTSPARVASYLRSWPAPAAFRMEPEADHFLEGSLVSATGFLSQHMKEWLQP
jgi:alpha/beta superfamily hydrolase